MNEVSNYRPVAILNTFAKLFEHLVHHRVLAHVSPYLDTSQHAFLPRRGTVSNLLEYTTILSERLESHDQVDVLYADLSKAFDKISHDRLLNKLQIFGITGHLQLLRPASFSVPTLWFSMERNLMSFILR